MSMLDSKANLIMKKLLALAGLALLAAAFRPGNASAQGPAIDRALATEYFAEAKSVSDKDHGAVWEVPLCGPLLVVHPEPPDAAAQHGDLQRKQQDRAG